MAYLVSLTSRAERDLAAWYEDIDARNSEAALAWYRGLKRAILTLGEFPNRCPRTPETAGLRHLLYGREPYVYRVIYRVLERKKQVEVVHIRHGFRRELRPEDFPGE